MLDKFIISSQLSASSSQPRRLMLDADNYSITSIRWGTFATIPRTAAVSGRSITWFSLVNPKPLITSFCFSGAQIADRTHFRWILPLPAFDFFAVISEPQWPVISDQWPENLAPHGLPV